MLDSSISVHVYYVQCLSTSYTLATWVIYSYFISWLSLPSCFNFNHSHSISVWPSELFSNFLYIYHAVYFILGIFSMQDIYYTVYFYSTWVHLQGIYIFKRLYFQTFRVWQGFIGICSRIDLTVLWTACRTFHCLLACVQICSPCSSLRVTGQGEIFHINYMRKTGASRTWFLDLV
jgi:hypothetical protein